MLDLTSQVKSGQSRAFTLIELLVVIGIITILIGILIPASSGMRRAANNATTTNLINTIETAINQYQLDQHDWPGPFDAFDRQPTPVTAPPAGWNQINGVTLSDVRPGAVNAAFVTRSEELVLALTGGLNIVRNTAPPFAVTAFNYDPANLDRGHPNFGLRNRSRMKDMMGSARSRSDSNLLTAQFGNDTAIPEFIDSYGGPIIYVRAAKGQSTTLAYYFYDPSAVPAVINLDQSALALEARRYTSDANVLFPPTYLENENLGSGSVLPRPTRQQDRYVLISAGFDKKFGTKDDVTSFGPPKLN